jgi:hypothetical protein
LLAKFEGFRNTQNGVCVRADVQWAGKGRYKPSWEKAMADDDTQAELERLRKENAALKKGTSSNVRMKVSEKGALSVYGMGRFPVTLYKEQWLKLLDMADDIRAFLAANDAQLKAKE